MDKTIENQRGLWRFTRIKDSNVQGYHFGGPYTKDYNMMHPCEQRQ